GRDSGTAVETRRGQLAVLLAATIAVAVILIATQPRDVFWGSDSGNRFIQLQSFLRTGGLAIEHRWPIGHHFLNINGKTYSYYSPIFSILAALFYPAGLFVLPIAGTLLLIALLPRLTSAPILPLGLIVIFGTPIFWYTIVF